MKHGLVEFYEGDSENTRDLGRRESLLGYVPLAARFCQEYTRTELVGRGARRQGLT